MPRPKQHATPAERQHAYRERCRERGTDAAGIPLGLAWRKTGDQVRPAPEAGDKRRTARKASKERQKRAGTFRKWKTPSKFDRAEFVAIDGEGWDVGPEEQHAVGDGSYTSREHRYVLLYASTGDELYRGGERLGTEECLDFLCDVSKQHKRAILCCYGAGYDMQHMLMWGLTREECTRLQGGQRVIWKGERHVYSMECRVRKVLTVRRYVPGAEKPDVVAKLWDVLGFFQGPFVDTLLRWFGKDFAPLQEIAVMKNLRSTFTPDHIDEIRTYNKNECDCLVALMQKLQIAIGALGLKITRWDGAGAVAGAMNAAHKVKDAKCDSSPEVFDAARTAYSGGHIEACLIGHAPDVPVYHYDVNSAYPSQFRNLPDLTKGEWKHGRGVPPPGFTLVRSAWQFPDNLPFYPLFYRTRQHSILYASVGHGWHWLSEYECGVEFARLFGGEVECIEWWHFQRDVGATRPFHWIETYYEQRKQWVQHPDEEWQAGAEKVIKLGLNSLYGKTAQQVGYKVDAFGNVTPPTYFQIEWAGYVTAGCRAQLMHAAMQAPQSIIAFATDGLFSLEPLDLHCPTEKELGAWEFKRHDGMTLVMPGVYWLHDTKKTAHFSRGFDKDNLADPSYIIDCWRKGKEEAAVTQTRLIGLGTACVSDALWEMRGRFATATRSMSIRGASTKRLALSASAKPHRGWCRTMAAPNDDYIELLRPTIDEIKEACISRPYPIAWLGDDMPDLSGLREEDEERDASLA